MLRLPEIRKFYPPNLQPFGSFLLREYLQHKILEIIYNSDYARQLAFLGGTCLRILHGNQRFSEDLDFDNFGLSASDFNQISELVRRALELEGYQVEIKTVKKGTFHCYVRFPHILFEEKLSGHREQKILIQLDTEPQNFEFEPELILLNKFDVFTEIFATPLPLLLAQKYNAILNRKRNKGRDFFDVVFLESLDAKINFDYLHQKVNISNSKDLKKAVLEKCQNLDIKEMADDVAPFLFQSKDRKKVELFPKWVEQNL